MYGKNKLDHFCCHFLSLKSHKRVISIKLAAFPITSELYKCIFRMLDLLYEDLQDSLEVLGTLWLSHQPIKKSKQIIDWVVDA